MPGIIAPQSNAVLEEKIPANVRAQLKSKSQEFESFYVYQMIELMSPKNDSKVMNGGPGEDMFRHNMNEQLAKNISQHGGFGLADSVYHELLVQQASTITPQQKYQMGANR